MNAPRFPRSPDIHNRPFADGKNPFADEQAVNATEREDGSESAYAASVIDDRSAKESVQYEAFLPNRSRLLVILAAIGAVLSGTSVVLALLAISSTDWVEGMFYGSPISLISVAFSIPACAMAFGDLRAIRAGAMDPQARRGTRIAFWLGLLGVLVGVLPAIGAIAAIIFSF